MDRQCHLLCQLISIKISLFAGSIQESYPILGEVFDISMTLKSFLNDIEVDFLLIFHNGFTAIILLDQKHTGVLRSLPLMHRILYLWYCFIILQT